jgi:hypothetical protein
LAQIGAVAPKEKKKNLIILITKYYYSAEMNNGKEGHIARKAELRNSCDNLVG